MEKNLLACGLAFLISFSLMPASAYAVPGMEYWNPITKVALQVDAETIPDNVVSLGSAAAISWYYTPASISTNSRIEVAGAVNIILVDGSTLTANVGTHVGPSSSLTIYEQERGTGHLIATTDSSTRNAGIGGNGSTTGSGESSGTITICGGMVSANISGNSDHSGAEIGGGSSVTRGSGQTVTHV